MSYQVTSSSNPRIKRLADLAERAHRDAEGVFVVEGMRLFERALSAGMSPLEVYVDGSVDSGWEPAVMVHPDVLDRVSYRRRSQGILAVFAQYRTLLSDLECDDPALILVTDSVEKPGNLGAVLRTADAVGADAVIETGPLDLFNPNLLRASTGACFSVPALTCDLDMLLPWLTGNGIALVAADPSAPGRLWDADLTGPVALMVGAEDTGLSSQATAAADQHLAIPMSGIVDSLNTSVALAVMAYEALRQRAQNSI